LGFYAAGHIGPPNEPVAAKNFIRLIDAKTNMILKESTPPRNDTAQKVEWELKEFAGKEGYLEVVDGDTRGAYAWLAVGRFEPNVVAMPALSPRDIEDRLITTANLISQYELAEGTRGLSALLDSSALSPRVLAALVRAIGATAKQAAITALAVVAEDPVSPETLRRQIAKAAARADGKSVHDAVTEAFRQCPARLQTALADALAGEVAGRELVLGLIEKGIAPARMLQNPPLKNRLLSTAKTDEDKQALENRLALILAFLPTADDALSQLIKTRQAGFQKAQADISRGQEVFKKHCAACHQVDGAGSVVGPQLDGIGNRGLERLLEDVLDPNRNVDVAFRISTIATEDGTVHTGLFRRDEGAVRILVDQKGKEFTIKRDEITEEKKSNLSLMPSNVAEIVPENEFFDLTAFLLSRKTPPKEAPMTKSQ
jgi:putative heme-binding domain-containing protein